MILRIGILVAFLTLSIEGQKLHESMTEDEIQSVFHRRSDTMHEVDYEVVPLIHKNEGNRIRRSISDTIHLRAFDQNYTLYIEENNNILVGKETPVFLAKRSFARSASDNLVSFTRTQFPLPGNFKLYHDLKNRAAVTMLRDSNRRVHVNGVVGHNIAIRSLPPRVHDIMGYSKSVSKSAYTADDFDYESFFTSSIPTHHVVIRTKENHFDDIDKQIGQWNFKSNWREPKTKYVVTKVIKKNGVPIQNIQKTVDNGLGSSEENDAFEDYKKKWNLNINSGLSKKNVMTNHHTIYNPQKNTESSIAKGNDLNEIKKKIEEWKLKWNSKKNTESSETNDVDNGPYFKNSQKSEISKSSSIPDTVYPQILVVVDYDTFKIHNENLESLTQYMIAFWNAVDLRYREMSKPNVRLNIAGVIVPKDRKSAPYLDSHVYNSETILVDDTLTDLGEFFAKRKSHELTEYDVIVGMSYRNLGSVRNGVLNKDTSGLASFRGACKIDIGHAVAIIKDTGGFMGITTAAHEVAHTLGAPHDDKTSAVVPGGPCNWEDGYLMSYNRRDERGQHWSKCSIRAMQDFMVEDQAVCLRNKPEVGKSYSKILPGRLLSRDEQCQKSMDMVSFKEEESNCAVLYCAKYYKDSVLRQTAQRPPAEGSYCGEKQICLNAKCVKDPEL